MLRDLQSCAEVQEQQKSSELSTERTEDSSGHIPGGNAVSAAAWVRQQQQHRARATTARRIAGSLAISLLLLLQAFLKQLLRCQSLTVLLHPWVGFTWSFRILAYFIATLPWKKMGREIEDSEAASMMVCSCSPSSVYKRLFGEQSASLAHRMSFFSVPRKVGERFGNKPGKAHEMD